MRSLRQNLKPKTYRIKVNKFFLLYGCLLCLCKPVIGPWALRQYNALELTNQRALYPLQKQAMSLSDYLLSNVNILYSLFEVINADSQLIIFRLSVCFFIFLSGKEKQPRNFEWNKSLKQTIGWRRSHIK